MAYEPCPKCGKEKHQLNACKHCGFTRSSQSKNAERSSIPKKRKVQIRTAKPAKKPKTVSIPKRKARKKQRHGPARLQGVTVKLISQRGTKLQGKYSCCSCGANVDNPTRYAESNVGPVVLCASCKSRIRRESFPPKDYDALDLAETGGLFEGNRRRH